ncbi:hypothetical protein DSUL_20002 [Desulfovibrionales bacterium]
MPPDIKFEDVYDPESGKTFRLPFIAGTEPSKNHNTKEKKKSIRRRTF